MSFYDELETRSADAREASLAECLPALVARAAGLPGHALGEVDADGITSRAALARLPVLRKSALMEAQAARPPFGGLATLPVTGFSHVFQSPGPIYEPGSAITTGGASAGSSTRSASAKATSCRTASATT